MNTVLWYFIDVFFRGYPPTKRRDHFKGGFALHVQFKSISSIYLMQVSPYSN